MATKTRNPQTSAIHPGNPRVPETLHPGIRPYRPTTHQPSEKGNCLPVDGRTYPSSRQTNRHHLKRPRPLPARYYTKSTKKRSEKDQWDTIPRPLTPPNETTISTTENSWPSSEASKTGYI